MPDTQTDIYKEHQQYWHKYIYYLLTINGAAIVYSINKLENKTFDIALYILLAAVICWIISFYCGLKTLKYSLHQMGVKGVISLIDNDIDKHLEGDEGLKKMTKNEMAKGGKKKEVAAKYFNKFQFPFLILGVIFYTLWQIVEMYFRSV